MQQHIKSYYDKIEAVIAARSKMKKPKTARKGLLSPDNVGSSSSKERSQIETIADMVEGIREAKEEILNARK